MDRFLTTSSSKRSRSSSSHSGHEGNVSPETRAKQYPESFYASGDRLFCKVCNVVVNHIRKSTLDAHLLSSKHLILELKDKSKKKKVGHHSIFLECSVDLCVLFFVYLSNNKYQVYV